MARIARSRELGSFVTRFIDEVKNTLQTPWEDDQGVHGAMKRALTQGQNKVNTNVSQQVLTARMTLGANNSIYLQSGMMMLWSGEMSHDQQYMMYPSSTEVGDLQHSAARGMINGLLQRVLTLRDEQRRIQDVADSVLAYLMGIEDVRRYVETIWTRNKSSIQTSFNTLESFRDVPAGDKNANIPTGPDGELDPQNHYLSEFARLRNIGAHCKLATLTQILHRLVTNKNVLTRISGVETETKNVFDVIQDMVKAASTTDSDVATALMKAAMRYDTNLRDRTDDHFLYSSSFWADDMDDNVGDSQLVLNTREGMKRLAQKLSKMPDKTELLARVVDMIQTGKVFNTENTVDKFNDINITTAIKDREQQTKSAIKDWKDMIGGDAGNAQTPKERAYPQDNDNRGLYVMAALKLYNTMDQLGPHQKGNRYTKIREFSNVLTIKQHITTIIQRIVHMEEGERLTHKKTLKRALDAADIVTNVEGNGVGLPTYTTQVGYSDASSSEDKMFKPVYWTNSTLTAPRQKGTKSTTDMSYHVCQVAVLESLIEHEIPGRLLHPSPELLEYTWCLKAAARIMQISPLAAIRNTCNGGDDVGTAMRGPPVQTLSSLCIARQTGGQQKKHVPFIPGILHRGLVANVAQPRQQSIEDVVVGVGDGKIDLTPDVPDVQEEEKPISGYPEFLDLDSIRQVLGAGLVANETIRKLENDKSIVNKLKTDIEKTPPHSNRAPTNIIQDMDERSRRTAVWEDALRELSISGDRLYGFLRTMAGCLHEDVTAILKLEDKSMETSQRNLREQRKEVAKNVSSFGQRLIDSLLTNIFKQSKLKVDLSTDGTGSANMLAGSLVVLSDDNVDQIRELASGQSGLPFFQQRVDLDRALRQQTGMPMQLNMLVKHVSDILDQYRTQTIQALEVGQQDAVHASLEYLAEPKNSFVIRLKNETYAAIHTAFDRLCTEAAHHGIPEQSFTAWECIEGENRQLRDQFAQLAAYSLSHSRVFSSRDSAYVTRDAQRTNTVMLGIALQKTIARLREYIHTRRGGVKPREHLRTHLKINLRDLSFLSSTQ